MLEINSTGNFEPTVSLRGSTDTLRALNLKVWLKPASSKVDSNGAMILTITNVTQNKKVVAKRSGKFATSASAEFFASVTAIGMEDTLDVDSKDWITGNFKSGDEYKIEFEISGRTTSDIEIRMQSRGLGTDIVRSSDGSGRIALTSDNLTAGNVNV